MESSCDRERIDDDGDNSSERTAFDAPSVSPRHDSWRIALYYLYFDLTSTQLEEHVLFQTEVCEMLGLKGRVRISHEGINGVLSGTLSDLQLYEERITNALQDLSTTEIETTHDETEGVMNGAKGRIQLDVKYCHLRTDLPVRQQLFDHLMVKETKTVISLFDKPLSDEYKKDKRGKSSSRASRNHRRKERKKHEEEHQLHQMSGDAECSDLGGNVDSTFYMQSLQKAVMAEPLQPAPHLTASEWNAMLDGVASPHSALILDVRNVYESRVGHFSHPSTPTLLTNTRKYSDLPQLLAQNEHLQNQQTQRVFMYCTGGVRCERVSMLMQELYPDKEIYQLEGGIQKYLHDCSDQNQHDDHSTGLDSELSGVTTTSHHNNRPQYFKGKNFVFDPRRTDPIHFGETVGKCMACGTPHDDYDNGHAPCEDKAARCNTCRMLVLICNDCRPMYIGHGEKPQLQQMNQEEAGGNELCPHKTDKRLMLYCQLDHCIHEGAAPEPELLRDS